MLWVVTVVLIIFVIDLMIYYKYSYKSKVFNYILVFIMLFGNPISSLISMRITGIILAVYYDKYIYLGVDEFKFSLTFFYLGSIAIMSFFIYKFIAKLQGKKVSIYKYSNFSFSTIYIVYINYLYAYDIYFYFNSEYAHLYMIIIFFLSLYVCICFLLKFIIYIIKSKENKNVWY